MVIHIIRRDTALGLVPLVYKQSGVFYAMVVCGKLTQILGGLENDQLC